MDIISNTNNSQTANLTEHQINFDTLDNITLNQKLETIFNNLIYNNNQDFKLTPKIFDTKNISILFEYFFNRLNDITTVPFISEKKNNIFQFLSEILINNLQKIYEEKEQEKILKFFYNLNFFQIFSQTLKKLDFPLFKEKFTLFIKVSFIHFISF